MALPDILTRLQDRRLKPAGDGRWMALCPAHEDSTASLSVARGTGGKVLLHCHAGCGTESVIEALGLRVTDLFDGSATEQAAKETLPENKWPVTSTYVYDGPMGDPIFKVLRLTSPDSGRKVFRQHRAGPGGQWIPGMDGVERVLYRLPALRDADPEDFVFVVEGERDADNLTALGLIATTNAGGAEKWLPTYSEVLRGRKVVITPDNDPPGDKHAETVSNALDGIAKSVRILRLPGLPHKGDVTDWIGMGGTAEQLRAMAMRLDTGASFMPSPQRIIGERADRLEAGRNRLTFGVSFLDEAMGGITRRDLILVGAKSGAGKTQLALNIAVANCRKGKRVHYFALEAEDRELERRMKFQILAGAYYRHAVSHRRLRFTDWYHGDLDAELHFFEDRADADLATLLKNLKTYYRVGSFTGDDFVKHLQAIRDETDLVILDHFHYVDSKDENENRAQRQLLKQIRDSALTADRPVIVVGHIRKSDPRSATLVPTEEAFHGSSDIVKIATKAVMIAPDYETPTSDTSMWSTYVRIVKCRQDSSLTRYCARLTYDTRTDAYLPEYTLGRLVDGDRIWEPVSLFALPTWKRTEMEQQ